MKRSFNLPDDLYDWAALDAQARGLSVNTIIILLLEEYKNSRSAGEVKVKPAKDFADGSKGFDDGPKGFD